ncbi:MAG: carbon storage regulator, partial [Calditrichaeota bacterium]|nr:carbon storage regulator [Calditrichota bacterium]
EKIRIGNDIILTVLDNQSGQVKIGIGVYVHHPRAFQRKFLYRISSPLLRQSGKGYS